MAKSIKENQSVFHIYQAIGFWARCYGWHCFRYQQQLLFLSSCNAVHGVGLKAPLWVLFVNQQGAPLGKWRRLKPNRLLWQGGAYGVLERAHMPREKRRMLDAALKTKPSWITMTRYWEVDCLGRRYYEK